MRFQCTVHSEALLNEMYLVARAGQVFYSLEEQLNYLYAILDLCGYHAVDVGCA